MEEIFTNLYDTIKETKTKAFNYSRIKEKALCINFVEIPHTEYCVMTISIMENKRRNIALSAQEFIIFMNEMDKTIVNLNSRFDADFPCFTILHDSMNKREEKRWNDQLNCHKSYLIPEHLLFATLEEFASDSFESLIMMKSGFKEINFYVNTKDHNLKITHFSK